ncbi:nucleocapsid protein [Ceratitis capitata sigmavirus]|uniref:Nucleoprotein n=3 Tax=root TaxID=1 RepID=W8AKA8_CERCA|nr:nucleocapsid protein [Ceratitis capitata sigmavirus]AMK09266.1 nucleocapsid protein [Ceratitis capitata sigmavirus]
MTTNGKKIVNINSKKSYVVPCVYAERSPEFPIDWFDTTRDKPILNIQIFKECDLDKARQYADAFLKGTIHGTIPVTTYLYYLFLTAKETLTRDWTSYRMNLKASEQVTPLSLLTVNKEEVDQTPLTNPTTLDNNSDKSILLALVGIYRLHTTHPALVDIVTDRINLLIQQATPSDKVQYSVDLAKTNSGYLSGNDSVEILLSALDMFADKFPANKYSQARIGTIILRYAGCSALLDLTYMTKMIACDGVLDVLQWVFLPRVGQELDAMLSKEDSEITKEDSYFPYLLGLRLSSKSPYAASSAPQLHHLVHAVGSLMGLSRSINALLIDPGTPNMVANNAALIFLANKRLSGLKVVYMNEDDAKVNQTQQEKASQTRQQNISEEDALSSRDLDDEQPKTPRDWFNWYCDKDWKFTKKEYLEIRDAVMSIKNPRSGTVGAWTVETFLSLINADIY